jgi:hypothetical protein
MLSSLGGVMSVHNDVNALELGRFILQIDRAQRDHRVTPGEAKTLTTQGRRVVLHSGNKDAAKRAVADEYERLDGLRAEPLSGEALAVVTRARRELA